MSNTELLVLAAKAAGYPVEVVGDQVWINGDYQAVTSTRPWWPLTDDGDALRLAVKCALHVDLSSTSISVYYWLKDESCDSVDEDFNNDPCAATRRCVVRAAAEIGRSMP